MYEVNAHTKDRIFIISVLIGAKQGYLPLTSAPNIEIKLKQCLEYYRYSV